MTKFIFYTSAVFAGLYSIMLAATLLGFGTDPHNTFSVKVHVYLIMAYLAHQRIEAERVDVPQVVVYTGQASNHREPT